MSRQISFRLRQDPRQLIEQARSTAASNGIHMAGDTAAGKFSGHGIEGRYNISDGTLAITILRKPMLVPWSMIESRLQAFFSA